MERKKSAHRIGIWLLVISALVFSTAGLFAKGVSAGSWDVIFWRGVFGGVIAFGFLAARGQIGIEWRAVGRTRRFSWAVAILGAISTAMFIAAFKETSIANVALIYAAAPMLTATLAWIVMRERMAWPVVVGAIVAFCGVVVIMSGSLGGIVGGGNLTGDLLAVGMTIGMGTVIVIYRRYPQTPVVIPMVGSSVLLLPVCMVFGAPFAVAPQEVAILAVFGAVFALASVLLAQGSKRVPSGEAALLSSLEAPLAPLWAWLLFSQMPPLETFIGGALILVAVIGSQVIRTKRG